MRKTTLKSIHVNNNARIQEPCTLIGHVEDPDVLLLVNLSRRMHMFLKQIN